MFSFFPPFFSLNLESEQGLSGLLGWQYVVVAVTAVVFAFFLSPKRKVEYPAAPANSQFYSFIECVKFYPIISTIILK
jgi:hypothetical protein